MYMAPEIEKRCRSAAPQLLTVLTDVLHHFEWDTSGGEEEAVYDRAQAVIRWINTGAELDRLAALRVHGVFIKEEEQ